MPKFAGGLWEDEQFEIEINYEFETTYDSKDTAPCEHALSYRSEEKVGYKKKVGYQKPHPNRWTAHYWTVPRVVVAWNEGGHCSTGVCLDCILKAAKTLEGKV